MTDSLNQLGKVRALVCAEDGPSLASEADALALIGEAATIRARLVVVPVGRLSADFFRLETRVAGAITQKLVNYGMQLVVVGDISSHVAASRALSDYVREANRGRSLWFCDSLAALAARLGAGPGEESPT